MPRVRTHTLAAALVATAAVAACSSSSAKDAAVRELSMDEVERALGTAGFHVFDANTPELYEKHHVPGARHVQGKAVAQALPPEKDARLVFYCTSPS